jgi:hypothetical protein
LGVAVPLSLLYPAFFPENWENLLLLKSSFPNPEVNIPRDSMGDFSDSPGKRRIDVADSGKNQEHSVLQFPLFEF